MDILIKDGIHQIEKNKWVVTNSDKLNTGDWTLTNTNQLLKYDSPHKGELEIAYQQGTRKIILTIGFKIKGIPYANLPTDFDEEEFFCKEYGVTVKEYRYFIDNCSLDRNKNEIKFGKDRNDRYYSILNSIDGYNKRKYGVEQYTPQIDNIIEIELEWVYVPQLDGTFKKMVVAQKDYKGNMMLTITSFKHGN